MVHPTSIAHEPYFLQIEMLEMQVEVALIEQTVGNDGTSTSKAGTLRTELQAWRRLFEPKLVRRTLIGVVMMIFQRMFIFARLSCRPPSETMTNPHAFALRRMERDQRAAILRPYPYALSLTAR